MLLGWFTETFWDFGGREGRRRKKRRDGKHTHTHKREQGGKRGEGEETNDKERSRLKGRGKKQMRKEGEEQGRDNRSKGGGCLWVVPWRCLSRLLWGEVTERCGGYCCANFFGLGFKIDSAIAPKRQ